MKYAITHIPTGETRIYEDEYEYSEFMWTEGNYSCDCNRHLFFERAIGNEPEEDMPCGNTLYKAIYLGE
jgi:hypothetical protein